MMDSAANRGPRPRRSSRYRSARSVGSNNNKRGRVRGPLLPVQGSKWTTVKLGLLCCGASLLGLAMVGPLLFLDNNTSNVATDEYTNNGNGNSRSEEQEGVGGLQKAHGIHGILQNSKHIRRNWISKLNQAEESVIEAVHRRNFLREEPLQQQRPTQPLYERAQNVVNHVTTDTSKSHGDPPKENKAKPILHSKQQKNVELPRTPPPVTLNEVEQLARGVASLPMSATPALIGAQRGTLSCSNRNTNNNNGNKDDAAHDLIYWNDPQGTRDIQFRTPFVLNEDDPTRYVTFEPDQGGWNNIRMSLETIFVYALATGRTLVLPPKRPMYLIGHGEEGAKSFSSFFSLDHIKETLQQRNIQIITMTVFLQKEGIGSTGGLLNLTMQESQDLTPMAEMCTYGANNQRECEKLMKVLRTKGIQPKMNAERHCLIMDEEIFLHGGNYSTAPKEIRLKQRVERFCGQRTPVYYSQELHAPKLIHWDALHLDYRLLSHFYVFFFFTNPIVGNYYKRFVRDVMQYNDEIFCAAAKIVQALQQQVKELSNNNTSFSTLHIRRGDLQFKEVKFDAETWYNNSKEIWKPNELLYIATDERNRSWFDPIKKYHSVRFLDDYVGKDKVAGLEHIDSAYLGMIETIVAAQGRTFVGTWHSTFTSYINRIRGYLGKPMTDSWHSYLPRKTSMHGWEYPNGNFPAREWPIGWVGIDGDIVLKEEQIPQQQAATVSEHVSGGVDGPRQEEHLARGVAGLPMSETPALSGASRAHIQCDGPNNVDSLAYWNDPQGQRDANFHSPFAPNPESSGGAGGPSQFKAKYITFSPDRGGWNNVRMSMEIIFIMAAATGRTLVLPPEQNLYLLRQDTERQNRGFADFFPLHLPEFQKRVKVITMSEFIAREGGSEGQLPIPQENRTIITKIAEKCELMKKKDTFCGKLYDHLATIGHVPSLFATHNCVVFDKDVYEGRTIKPESSNASQVFCGPERKVVYWDKELRDPVLIHLKSAEKEYRLLAHFYGFLYFTDPAVDNFYKRFVRDFLHYHDSIFCAAGKIVSALQAEGKKHGYSVDEEGSGGYSAMHIRRGDFQYQRVKISAKEWYNNTKELWKPKEIIFIATDEKNKTWFDPIAEHHELRFLDDYWDMAGMNDLDPNYAGMVDTIVASKGRVFAGTWFSTFTGYINRMRGYHGMSMKDSWYSFPPKKTALHTWKKDGKFAYAYEWPAGWIGVDGDVFPSREKF